MGAVALQGVAFDEGECTCSSGASVTRYSEEVGKRDERVSFFVGCAKRKKWKRREVNCRKVLCKSKPLARMVGMHVPSSSASSGNAKDSPGVTGLDPLSLGGA